MQHKCSTLFRAFIEMDVEEMAYKMGNSILAFWFFC